MSGPWEDFAGQGGPWTDYAPTRSAWDEAKRQTGLVGRYVAEGVAAMPLAAMDAGVALRNLATGSQYEMPSQMFQQGLNAVGFPEPQGSLEKGTGLLWSGVAGAKALPNPTVGGSDSSIMDFLMRGKSAGMEAPTVDATRNATKQMLVRKSQDAGYVVPPSTTNPGLMNSVLEGIAGKTKTAQVAAIRNQGVTTNLGKDALGLSRSADLTEKSIKAVRNEAYGAYKAIRQAGPISSDGQFVADVQAAIADHSNMATDLPSLADTSIVKRAADLVPIDEAGNVMPKEMDANTAVSAIRRLRELADSSFRAGEGSTGAAYRKMADAVESLIERNLAAKGEDGAKLLADYRAAREMIAKTYSVEDAFNSATGEVSARKLGQAVNRGEPLAGPLKTAGDFGRSFQKASADVKESFPDFSPIDLYGAGGMAAMTQDPRFLAVPFIRRGVREMLLTPWAQRYLATPTQGGLLGPALTPTLGYGLLSAGQ